MQIIPADPEKPDAIASLIAENANIPEHKARQIAASLYGFDSWYTLHSQLSGDRTLPDETAELTEVRRRNANQITVLRQSLSLSKDDAKCLAHFLGATNLSPAKYVIVSREKNRIFRNSEEEISAGVDKMFGAGSIDLIENARRSSPGKSKPWIDALAQHFGFTLTIRIENESEAMRKVAETQSTDGKIWPIYFSGLGYEPGDTMDEDVRNVQKTIAHHEVQALLLFNSVLVKPSRRPGQTKTQDVIIYGGKILRNKSWNDFLMPTEGIDEILSYRIQSINDLSAKFFEDHIIEKGLVLATSLAKLTARFDIPNLNLNFMRTSHDWTLISMFPKEAIKAMKAMTKLSGDLS